MVELHMADFMGEKDENESVKLERSFTGMSRKSCAPSWTNDGVMESSLGVHLAVTRV